MISETLKAVLNKLISRGIVYPHNHMRLPNLMRMGWKAHERGEVKDAIYNGIRKGYIIVVKQDKKAFAIPRHKIGEINQLLYGGTF